MIWHYCMHVLRWLSACLACSAARIPSDLVYSKITRNLTLGHLTSSVWKITKVKDCSSETLHIWPYVCKAKMCLGGGSLFEKIVNNQLKNVNKDEDKRTIQLSLKHNLVLPTWGQKCTVSIFQKFTFDKFQLNHPVHVIHLSKFENMTQ